MGTPKGLITVKQVAKKLSYCETHVRTLAQRGKLPAIKRGHQWFFKPEDIEAILKPNNGSEKAGGIVDGGLG